MKRHSMRLQVESLENRAVPSGTSFASPIAIPDVMNHVGLVQQWQQLEGQHCEGSGSFNCVPPAAGVPVHSGTSSLSGTVFETSPGQFTSYPASGVTVTLTGTNHCGAKITETRDNE